MTKISNPFPRKIAAPNAQRESSGPNPPRIRREAQSQGRDAAKSIAYSPKPDKILDTTG
jgi:hypothetical protein